MKKSNLHVKVIIGIVAVIVLVIIGITLNKASVRRGLKSLSSEFSNGINRTITLYDYNGEEIMTWQGKFDVTEGETGIMFDSQDGKRTIINGGITVIEEE